MSFLERADEMIRRSVVWRSLFRNPYPNDERSRAYAVMNNVFLHIHPVRVRQHAVRFAYTFCLGGLSFFLFLTIMLSFTGYLLPWDQIAYWAITIGTNMGGYAPLFNTPVTVSTRNRKKLKPPRQNV